MLTSLYNIWTQLRKLTVSLPDVTLLRSQYFSSLHGHFSQYSSRGSALWSLEAWTVLHYEMYSDQVASFQFSDAGFNTPEIRTTLKHFESKATENIHAWVVHSTSTSGVSWNIGADSDFQTSSGVRRTHASLLQDPC